MDGKVNFLSEGMDKHYHTATAESLYQYPALMSIFYGFHCCSLACSVAEICAVCIVNRGITEASSLVWSAFEGLEALSL